MLKFNKFNRFNLLLTLKMGMYLSSPNLDVKIEKIENKNKEVKSVACALQGTPLSSLSPLTSLGWRVNMEDAHIAQFNISKPDEDIHVFGVFDGHGGLPTPSNLSYLIFQAKKWPTSSRITSSKSFSVPRISRTKTIPRLSKTLF